MLFLKQIDNVLVTPCEVCGFLASRKADMARHAKTHGPDSEYVCVFNSFFVTGFFLWLGNYRVGKGVNIQLSKNQTWKHIIVGSTFIPIN